MLASGLQWPDGQSVGLAAGLSPQWWPDSSLLSLVHRLADCQVSGASGAVAASRQRLGAGWQDGPASTLPPHRMRLGDELPQPQPQLSQDKDPLAGGRVRAPPANGGAGMQPAAANERRGMGEAGAALLLVPSGHCRPHSVCHWTVGRHRQARHRQSSGHWPYWPHSVLATLATVYWLHCTLATGHTATTHWPY